jgi:hypothetical protein
MFDFFIYNIFVWCIYTSASTTPTEDINIWFLCLIVNYNWCNIKYILMLKFNRLQYPIKFAC